MILVNIICWVCLRNIPNILWVLYYVSVQMLSFGVSKGPVKIKLSVFVSDADGLHPVWNTYGYKNNSWIQARVDYSVKSPHQVQFRNNELMNILFFVLTIIIVPDSLFYKPTIQHQVAGASHWMTSTLSGINLVMKPPQPPLLTLPPQPAPPHHLTWTVILKVVRLIVQCKIPF